MKKKKGCNLKRNLLYLEQVDLYEEIKNIKDAIWHILTNGRYDEGKIK